VASGILSAVPQARLAALYAGTNPRQLREAIYHAVEQLWQYPQPALESNRKEVAMTPR
jgi:histidinol-phosphate/aromatic aminotransferase/cobyric acid decarboxylase-like protein